MCTRADERQGEKEQVQESLNTHIWVRSDRMSNLARFGLFRLIAILVGMGWDGMVLQSEQSRQDVWIFNRGG